ncbi:TraC family protein [Geobacter sp. FeAm09]|uniref:TraC family protein n=1 Tax=Geobacter sp. FeAm09 TaxID=2597769 RepID=UPI00143D0260|nr:TraC family protein [Geobacter sp. FeAm09]
MLRQLRRLAQKIAGDYAGATAKELEDMHWHNPFSKYFTWFAHDDGEDQYNNSDGTQGAIWECTPLCFSSEKVLEVSEALLGLPLPPMSVLSVLFHADDHIKPYLDSYRALRADACDPNSPSFDPLIREAVENYCDYLESCTKGIKQLSYIPLRNFRLIISLKVPQKSDVVFSEIRNTVHEILVGMKLDPRPMKPGHFLEWLRRLMNDDVPETSASGENLAAYYDDSQPINEQILVAETEINVEKDHMQIGNRYWRCLTPKKYPKEVDPLQTKEAICGGIWGLRSDNDQHRTPYIYTLNIIYDDLSNYIGRKTDFIMMQQAVGGSKVRSLNRRKEEHLWASDKIELGQSFARVMPIMWFYDKTPEGADGAVKRAKSIFKSNGYVMQEERRILSALFLSALPLNMRANKLNLFLLKRDRVADPDAVCNMLPIQAEFSGSPDAKTIFQGRSGQIVPFSIFTKSALNYNGLICATSGGGKSFGENKVSFNELTTGTILRLIDIGYSYKKLCKIRNGRFIDIAHEDINVNPFTTISLDNKLDEEGFSPQLLDLSATSSIMKQMAFSTVDNPIISGTENILLKDATDWAFLEANGNDASVDDVYAYLKEYPQHVKDHDICTDTLREQAVHLAYNLRQFTSSGRFGKMFTGKSNFNIKDERLVVFELETLQNIPDLFNTLTLVVLDAMTRDLYLSDRSNPRLVKFDEAWKVLYGRGQNPMFVDIIGGGFRRARKYEGGFWVILQSILDKLKIGAVGDVIWGNADYKFYLESPDFEKALSEKLIDYDEFTIELLKGLQRNGTKYSEMYMDTPYGSGVVRIAENPFNYFLFTSNGRENAEMEAMVKNGMTWTEAINEMVRKYRS